MCSDKEKPSLSLTSSWASSSLSSPSSNVSSLSGSAFKEFKVISSPRDRLIDIAEDVGVVVVVGDVWVGDAGVGDGKSDEG